ncbi:hypothetical protein KCM76_05920 [Zooshikella marina]|uniref:Flavodoxin-like domain-containing protein n=1 Tax=Zooshikella ganghwensis TaxID=202772 RepID=A0A4V1IN91_9GAMM|nr:hypothetical protein [Zooshikella ganghwensis]MBU2705507.1 hypothetical protein [Zooshikella ganghwensis]RDH42911.1 hypothetical protein B9G39_05285 [Zooshikella ganghwensis]
MATITIVSSDQAKQSRYWVHTIVERLAAEHFTIEQQQPSLSSVSPPHRQVILVCETSPTNMAPIGYQELFSEIKQVNPILAGLSYGVIVFTPLTVMESVGHCSTTLIDEHLLELYAKRILEPLKLKLDQTDTVDHKLSAWLSRWVANTQVPQHIQNYS